MSTDADKLQQLLRQMDALATALRMTARDIDDEALQHATIAAGHSITASAHQMIAVASRPAAREIAGAATVSLDDRIVRHGPLRIDRATRRVTFGGQQRLGITKRAYEILVLLASAPDRVFTKEEIYREVWGGDMTVQRTRAVDVQVCRLRTALGAPGWISTVWGVGYRLVAAAPAEAAAAA